MTKYFCIYFMWSTRRSDVSRIRLNLEDVGNMCLESVRTLECLWKYYITHNVWKGETIDVLNDFSGLNSKWAQGTVTVQACKGEAVSTTSDTFGMQT